MICPLKFNLDTSNQNHEVVWQCEQANCQWWDSNHDQCCIKVFAQLKVKVAGLVSTHPA